MQFEEEKDKVNIDDIDMDDTINDYGILLQTEKNEATSEETAEGELDMDPASLEGEVKEDSIENAEQV